MTNYVHCEITGQSSLERGKLHSTPQLLSALSGSLLQIYRHLGVPCQPVVLDDYATPQGGCWF